MDRIEYVIDAIQEGHATLEPTVGGVRLRVPAAWLPEASREGDVVVAERRTEAGRNVLTLALDAAARRVREERLRALRDRLPKAPPGDLEL
jgi:hypothetical protein